MSTAELDGLKVTGKEKDCVLVSDKNNQPHVLLTDAEGELRWYPMSDADPESAYRANEWFKHGLQMFKEKALSADDTQKLREVLLAISVISNFFEYTEDMVGHMMDQMIVKFSFELYQKDHPSFKGTLQDLADSDDFMPYVNMIAMMSKAYADLVGEVRESADQAKEDAQNLNK